MLPSEEEYWELKKETERLRIENEKTKAENDKRWERTSKNLDRLEEEVAKAVSAVRSLGGNIGSSTEELFLNSIEKTMEIDDIKYYEMARNYVVVSSENGKKLAEIDAILFNKKYICIIEIKHRGTKEDMIKLIEKTIPTFQAVETRFQKYEIIPVLAAMSFEQDVPSQSKKLKITLLKYRGEHFQVIH
ncbi:MAG: hypothetical protein QM536_06975 [Chitinophagaceae bacterium]|nr:hypothetical protein [Chitinophagaceae bacterium]